jgi:phosphate-selective porin OprO/OprP
MAAERLARAAVLTCIVATMGAAQVWAEEKRVVDELLDILRANKQISEQQYRSLKQRADQERQQDRQQQAVEPTAVPTPTAVLAAAPPPTAPPGETMRAYFKEGYNLETADGKFKLNIGARAQLDWNISDPGGAVKEEFGLRGTPTGVEFRRARLSLAGLMYGIVDYKFEYDFADGNVAFKDVYMGMKKVPIVQYVRVGHFKEPFSLEEITSDDFVTFQERALPNAFAPSRNTGVAVMPVFFDERMTATAGAFRQTDDTGYGYGSDQEYNVTSRVTGLPWYDDGGRNLVHLGFSYSHKFRDQDEISFSQRPESHLFPVTLVDTDDIVTDGVDLINPELALVVGPWSLQAEYMHAFVSQVDNPNPDFGGFYIYGSYFLTEGDQRRYRPANGAFEKPIPKSDFGWGEGSGWGAWEVAARYSRLDLSSENVDGGAEDNISGQLNWYLNPNTKIGLNYVWAHLETVGDTNIVQGRFQLTY